MTDEERNPLEAMVGGMIETLRVTEMWQLLTEAEEFIAWRCPWPDDEDARDLTRRIGELLDHFQPDRERPKLGPS
jgi:hypothetical protein